MNELASERKEGNKHNNIGSNKKYIASCSLVVYIICVNCIYDHIRSLQLIGRLTVDTIVTSSHTQLRALHVARGSREPRHVPQLLLFGNTIDFRELSCKLQVQRYIHFFRYIGFG